MGEAEEDSMITKHRWSVVGQEFYLLSTFSSEWMLEKSCCLAYCGPRIHLSGGQYWWFHMRASQKAAEYYLLATISYWVVKCTPSMVRLCSLGCLCIRVKETCWKFLICLFKSIPWHLLYSEKCLSVKLEDCPDCVTALAVLAGANFQSPR